MEILQETVTLQKSGKHKEAQKKLDEHLKKALVLRAEILVSSGQLEAALATYAYLAEQYADKELLALSMMASLYRRKQEFGQALRYYNEAIDLAVKDGKRVQDWVYGGQVECLKSLRIPLTEAIPLYREAICQMPALPNLVRTYMLHMQEAGMHSEAIVKELVEFQKATPKPLKSVIMEIAKYGGAKLVHEQFQSLMNEIAEDPQCRLLRQIFEAFCKGKTLAPEMILAYNALPPADKDFYFHFVQEAPSIVRPYRLKTQERENLQKQGVHIDALEEYFASKRESWMVSSRIPESAPGFVRERESFQYYQDAILRDGCFVWMNPLDMEEYRCIDSFFIYQATVYSFFAEEFFHLVCLGPSSDITGVFLPWRNSFVLLAQHMSTQVTEHMLTTLIVRLVDRYVVGQSNFENARKENRNVTLRSDIALNIGGIENFAHLVWNNYSAVERFTAQGLASNVTQLLQVCTEFFGPTKELFPELSHAKTMHLKARSDVQNIPFDLSNILVSAGGYYVDAALKKRIIARAEKKGTGGVRITSVQTPLVWLGIRCGDKIWVEQEQGLIRLIDRFHVRWPNITFLIDGFSHPDGIDHISGEWKAAEEELHALALRIAKGCKYPQHVVNLVGNTLLESIALAQRIDAYFCPIGTSQHKAGWFNVAPGVIYASPQWQNTEKEKLPGAWESECSARPTYLLEDSVTLIEGSGKRRSIDDRRLFIDNFTLDEDKVYEAILRALEERLSSAA